MLSPPGDKDAGVESSSSSDKPVPKTVKREIIPPPKASISLYISIMPLAFFMTAALGSAVAIYSFLNQTQSFIQDAVLALSLVTNSYSLVRLINSGNTSALSSPQLIWEFYNVASRFQSISNLGILCSNGGDQTTALAVHPPRFGGIVQIVDGSTGGATINRPIKDINWDSTLYLGATSPGTLPSYYAFPTGNTVRGPPVWGSPVIPNTEESNILFPLIQQIWKNYPPGSVGYGNPDAVYIATLSMASLGATFKLIPSTQNGVVFLVEGVSGKVLAASVGNSSVNLIGSKAVGNAVPIISDAVSSIISSSPFKTIPSLPRNYRMSTQYNNSAGDMFYIDAQYIVDLSGGLGWLLVVAIPTSDFNGDTASTLKTTIIIIAVICVATLVLSLLLTWRIVSPMKKLTMHLNYLSRLDFAGVNDLRAKSHFTEIGEMEFAFNKMFIKMFDALKNAETNSNQYPSYVQRMSSTGPGILRTSKTTLPSASLHRREPSSH
ncbi:hypothetical protein BDR26DRAFT_857660 [Obelidium mucronatum]|nr:hypothetical protein BDR26DRAFT_857660 [Obelidium mucronatum]